MSANIVIYPLPLLFTIIKNAKKMGAGGLMPYYWLFDFYFAHTLLKIIFFVKMMFCASGCR